MANWREQAVEIRKELDEAERRRAHQARARARAQKCGARTRKNGKCAQQPCKRPDGKGNGRCFMHGGLSTGPKTGPRAAKSPPDLTPVRLKYSKRARNALAASATEPIPVSWQDAEGNVESPTMSSSEQGQAVSGSSAKRAQRAGQGVGGGHAGPTSPDRPPGVGLSAGGPTPLTLSPLPSDSAPDFENLLGVTIGSLRLSAKEYQFRYEAVGGVPGIAAHRDRARRWVALVGCVLEFGAKS